MDIFSKYQWNFKGLREFVRNPIYSRGSKALLLDILLYAGANGISFPSRATLAKDMGLTIRQIGTLLKELKNTGNLDWVRGSKGKSNKYKINDKIYSKKLGEGKSISYTGGSLLPISRGSEFPTKEISKRNHVSARLLIEFKKAAKREASQIEINLLIGLCARYGDNLVLEAIEEAGKRNYPYVKIGLIGIILRDWELSGKPKPKPIFQPCGKNGCEAGFIITDNISKKCSCYKMYEKNLNYWKKDYFTG